jgi:hypothetical protein
LGKKKMMIMNGCFGVEKQWDLEIAEVLFPMELNRLAVQQD